MKSNHDKFPAVEAPGHADGACRGWAAAGAFTVGTLGCEYATLRVSFSQTALSLTSPLSKRKQVPVEGISSNAFGQ